MVHGVVLVLSQCCLDGSEQWRGGRDVLVGWRSGRFAARRARTGGAFS